MGGIKDDHPRALLWSLHRLGELMDEALQSVPVVLFGHTHRPVISERHGVTAVNPGSLAPKTKKRFVMWFSPSPGREISFEINI
ncbi:MAG: metallophosphoesterase family protein [Blautia sp.]